jgi:7-carboxy-7-deazaguanine synthase
MLGRATPTGIFGCPCNSPEEDLVLNAQPIEKQECNSGVLLDVHSVFYTIQGEGPYCGRPAVFIRLAGCNLQCPGCDTDYTSNRRWRAFDALAEDAFVLMGPRARLVVITGGEPFRQNIAPLCQYLIDHFAFDVQVETNGTLPPPKDLPEEVKIVCSPKTGKIHREIANRATCFKYVMSASSIGADGLPSHVLGHTAEPHVARPPNTYRGRVYLQPSDSRDSTLNKLNLDAVVGSCLRHGHTLQLQIHKLVNLE